MIYTLNIDWLSIFCIRESPLLNECGIYTLKLQEFPTRHFRSLYYIVKEKEKVAELQIDPFSSILPPDGAILKIENRFLYSSDLFDLIERLLNNFHLKFKSISRLDLCADFNTFYNNYNPRTLIEDFASEKIRKKGRAKGTLDFRQTTEKLLYNGIKFGDRQSDNIVYLYNKSLELKEVRDKIYIRDMWAANGLDVTKPVWRLEVSMKSKALKLIDKNTGECKEYNNIKTLQSITTELYFTMINRLFTFVHKDNNNISRCTKIVLFEGQPQTNTIFLRNVTGSNRTEKIFIKNLYLLQSRYRAFKELSNLPILADAERVMETMIKATDLQGWYNEKYRTWTTPHYK